MTYRFTARFAWGVDDPDQESCVQAGVAESDDEEGFSLHFMCDFEDPRPQEISLGMDTHCLVTPDQSTAYGCIRTVEFERDLLRVTLDPESLDDLELEDHVIEVVLRAPAEDVARLREVLPRILEYGRPDARPKLTMV
ncbi:Imm10 family immunity protein [Streptomyces sp. BPSDS2]|uniref:Imm10 family immunity protein n=1 Tax=Streptomyces sp. BPSDS2 TaxID=2571021 RepID=UPI0010C0A010|nr:Imm10 family immunity protein [Streptomyces sp. BPSDS2]